MIGMRSGKCKGQSRRRCWTVTRVWQLWHVGGGALLKSGGGLLKRYPCVINVCPIIRRHMRRSRIRVFWSIIFKGFSLGWMVWSCVVDVSHCACTTLLILPLIKLKVSEMDRAQSVISGHVVAKLACWSAAILPGMFLWLGIQTKVGCWDVWRDWWILWICRSIGCLLTLWGDRQV